MKPEDFLKAMDEFTKLTEWVTGLKNQLMTQGWSEMGAEQMVLTIVAKIPMGGQPDAETK